MTPPPLLIAFASIGLSALAQIALKVGMAHAVTGSAQVETSPWWRQIVAGLFQPAVLVGLFMYAGGALLWLYVLARWDVSKAYPLVGLGFVLTFMISVVFLGERVSWDRASGCILVCAGLILIVRS